MGFWDLTSRFVCLVVGIGYIHSGFNVPDRWKGLIQWVLGAVLCSVALRGFVHLPR